jgi:hypothetical protein
MSFASSSSGSYYFLTIFERFKDSSLKEELFFLLSITFISAIFLGNIFSSLTVNLSVAPSSGHEMIKG